MPGANKEKGFTLIELLIAMALALVVLAGLSGVFITQRKAYDVQEQTAEMTQTARAAMDMITRDLMLAGYDPASPPAPKITGLPYSATQLQVVADIDGSGDILDPGEDIIYAHNPNSMIITRRDVNGDNVAHTFAENVEAFDFQYFRGDGTTPVTTSSQNSQIRQVEITIVVRTSKPDPSYNDNNGHRAFTLTSRVTPLNLGL